MSFVPPAISSEIGKRAYKLMLELVAIPSVTGSDGGEDACAGFIFDWLSRLEYFRRNPGDLYFIGLKNDPLGRHSVAALLRAPRPSKKTVIFMGHCDVVDVDVCGSLREWAFDPHEYTARVGKLNLADDVRADLESGNYVFGRGVSDMKTAIALGMCLLEDYSAQKDEAEERDFNVLLLVVPDEEGDSVGMRGSVSFLAELKEREGLDFPVCICAEPAFEFGLPAVYFGTIGKIMPLYLCVGRESHAGTYYDGLNSTLVASYLNISLDGGRDTIETFGRQTFQPQCCLRMRDTRGRYAVTLPERSVLYYNCLTVEKTPAVIMEEMRTKAMSALKAALSHVGREDW
ncbi:MAG: M20/M25/M40 family metallo-hydrolase, partial [Synergistaceae bacterium]|nr:M20/M25/M40 family metallo-hydrolase [Synergistaceae bacterium]